MSINPFISIHRIDKQAKFPVLCTTPLPELEESINCLNWIFLAKKPTLLACDIKSLVIFEFKSNKLRVLQKIALHSSKFFFPNFLPLGEINCLSYHRLDIFTGSNDHSAAKLTLDKDIIKVPNAPPAF